MAFGALKASGEGVIGKRKHRVGHGTSAMPMETRPVGSNRILFRFSRGEENQDLEVFRDIKEAMIGVCFDEDDSPCLD